MSFSRKFLVEWLRVANGWQRIWFVGTVVSALYFLVVFPMSETNKGYARRFQTDLAVERDLKNPACAEYMSGEFSKLVAPPYSDDGGCYHIYVHRKYSENHAEINPDLYEQYWKKREREYWRMHTAVGAVLAVTVPALVYFLGLLVGWIARGFRQSNSAR